MAPSEQTVGPSTEERPLHAVPLRRRVRWLRAALPLLCGAERRQPERGAAEEAAAVSVLLPLVAKSAGRGLPASVALCSGSSGSPAALSTAVSMGRGPFCSCTARRRSARPGAQESAPSTSWGTAATSFGSEVSTAVRMLQSCFPARSYV